jgi:hypothetical protein
MTTLSPFGEQSLTVVAAAFDDRRSAQAVASELEHEPALEGEVAVIRPGDPLTARKLEPEQAGIWRTALRSHLIFGIAGALAGVTLSAVLVASWPAATLSPGYTLMAVTMFSTFFGMMFAGLLTLRPDHDRVITAVRRALRAGRWAVVVRPLDEARARMAMSRLRGLGATPVRSF